MTLRRLDHDICLAPTARFDDQDAQALRVIRNDWKDQLWGPAWSQHQWKRHQLGIWRAGLEISWIVRVVPRDRSQCFQGHYRWSEALNRLFRNVCNDGHRTPGEVKDAYVSWAKNVAQHDGIIGEGHLIAGLCAKAVNESGCMTAENRAVAASPYWLILIHRSAQAATLKPR